MLERRAAAPAANFALGFGLTVMVLGSFLFKEAITARIHFFHFMGIVFVVTCVLQIALGKVWRRDEPWTQVDSGDVDLTPWRYAKPAAAVLLVAVVSIYASFA